MKECKVCGKGSIMVGKRIKLRGNYNPQPKKRKYPNLQTVKLPDGKKIVACTQCIKTINKKVQV
ncbi:MAG: L28 family ribosomal protein [bacterium]